MLAETLDLAVEYDVDFVGLAGDIFHYKAPSKTSHELVARLIARLNRPVNVVTANISSKLSVYLSVQALGGLSARWMSPTRYAFITVSFAIL